MKKRTFNLQSRTVFSNRLKQTASIFIIVFLVIFSLDFSTSFLMNKKFPESLSITPTAKATHFYHSFSSGNLTLAVTPQTVDQITRNDDWINIPGVEGYCGSGLTNTHGVDPRTVLGTEYSNNALPGASPCVNANKGNPSAYNGSGVTEFDSGDYLAIGFQGNVQNNPYLTFFLNTTGQNDIRMSYDVIDIDGGNNDSVSQMALQYRVGETGNFANLPDGFVADATDGNRVSGRITKVYVTLPPAALNQPKVQLRILTTFAAGISGSQTPNEWIGVNNIVISNVTAPTAASVSVSGQVKSANGRGIRNVQVSLTDEYGQVRTVMTTTFGYYRFEDIPAGQTYTISVSGKKYSFTQPAHVLNLTGDTDEVNFVADN
jgi:hypothetical protein